MKKIYLLFLILFAFTTSVTVAQSSHDKISYQSVVRDGSNHLLYDTQVTVAVSIKNSGDAAVKYSETHTVTSNANGLISFLIGAGNNQNGNWNAVQWNRAEITMVTSVGGVVLSTHTLPLSAVPYALYAKNAGAASYADSVDINVVKHYVDQQGFLTEEVQVLSISNDTIFLTGGSWVKLPAGFSGDYNDLINKPDLKPVATSGDYNDLVNKPENLVQDANYVHTDNNYTDAEQTKLEGIEAGAEVNVQGDWTETDATKDSYIQHKPENLVQDANYVHTDNNYTTTEKDKLQGIEAGAEVNVQGDWTETDATKDSYIQHKPENLVQDPNYVHTDNNYTTAEQTKLEGIEAGAEVNVQGDWTETDATKDSYIQHKPENLVQDANYVHTDNNYTTAEKTKLEGIEAGAEVNVQGDWTETDATKDSYIQHKPENLVQDANYVHTDNNYTTSEKTKLEGIEAGAEVNVQGDWTETDATKDSYIQHKPENLVQDANYVHTDNNYTNAEQTKLEGIQAGAEVNVQSDWNVSDESSDAFIKNKPTIPDAQVQSDWNQTTTTAVDYIKNKPTDLVHDASYNHTDNNYTNAEQTKLEGIQAGAEVNVQSDWNVSDESSDAFIKNKPTIPDAQVQSDWNQTTTTAVDYIKNKPTDLVHDASYNHTDNNYTNAEKTKLEGIQAGAEVNVQSDWNVSDESSDAFIKNKPTIPDAQVQSDWNQTTTTAVDYIKNKPTDLVHDASYNHTDNNYTNAEKTKLEGIQAGAEVNVQSDWNVSDESSDAFIKNKPTIPDAQIQSDWNQTTTTAVDYIKNKPTDLVHDASYNHTDNNYTNAEQIKLEGIQAGAEVNVQSDWNVSDESSDAFIKNKPTIPDAQIQSDWNQTTTTAVDYIKNKPTDLVHDASYNHTDNNYTNAEQTKLEGIQAGAEVNVQSDWNVSDESSDAFIKNKPTIPDAQVQSDWNQTTTTAVDYIKNKPTDLVHDASYNHTDNNYTNAEQTKLEGIQAGAEVNVQSDWNVSDESSDAFIKNKPTIPDAQIQSDWNQTTTTAVDYIKNKPNIPTVNNATLTIKVSDGTAEGSYSSTAFTANDATDKTVTLAKVAGTGNYNDLTNTPTIPSAPGTLNTTNTEPLTTSSSEALSGNISLHKVSKTGSYDDLLNKPDINNAKLTIQKNGESVVTFTANQSRDTLVNIDIPAAPGTLKTDNVTAQEVSASEALSGNISLHKVSKTGSYDDLLNKPDINNAKLTIQKNGESVVTFTANQSRDTLVNIDIPVAPGTLKTDNATAQEVSASEALSGNISLHKVSKTGSYNDLLNKPDINNATLTIQKNGESVVTFTANQSRDTLVNIDIPAAPGTLKTDNATAQEVSASEALSGNISLHKVSKTGSYDDLLNKPDINNAKLTIQKNGESVVTFTANQSRDTLVNIDIPAAPGTLKTDNATAQEVSASEALSGNISLHKVSKTGSYDDLLNKPDINNATLTIQKNGESVVTFTANQSRDTLVNIDIPAAPGTLKTDNATAQEVSASEALSGNISLHKVSKTGSYDDLLNKPDINNATLTIQKNGESVVTFTANQSRDTLVNIDIPAAPGTLKTDNATAQEVSASEALSGNISLHKVSKTGSYSDLNNTPTKVSAFENDKGYLTAETDPTVNNATLTIKVSDGTAEGIYSSTAFTANDATDKTVTLAKVAGTGSYNDLNDKPEIGNGKLTIKYGTNPDVVYAANQDTNTTMTIQEPVYGTLTLTKNTGTQIGTFTANENKTIDITIPTAVTDLSDGSQYLKTADLCNTIQANCSNVALKNGNNQFTGTNTVPNGFVIKGDNATNETNCGNIVVNACDLWAVFDSLNRRITALENATPPVFNTISLTNPTVETMDVTADFTSDYIPITGYQFCYSTNSDMSEATCVPSNSNSITLSGLSSYTDYYVTVSATNKVGTTTSTPVVNERTLSHTPMGALQASTQDPQSVNVTVNGLDFMEPNEGTVQLFYMKKAGNSCSSDINSYTARSVSETLHTGDSYTETIPGLEVSTNYCVMAKVSNSGGIRVLGPVEATSGGAVSLTIVSDPQGTNNGITTRRCSGTPIVYTATLSDPDLADDYTYSWTLPTSSYISSYTIDNNTLTIFYNTNKTGWNLNVLCTAINKTNSSIKIVAPRNRIKITGWDAIPDVKLCEDSFLVTPKVDITATVDWGDNTPTVPNPTTADPHLYEAAGTYTITSTSSAGCSSTRTIVIEPSVTSCVVNSVHTGDEYINNGYNNVADDGLELINSDGEVIGVTDYDGNVYPVVQIGKRCWLKENMRCTHSPTTGSYLVNRSNSDIGSKAYYLTGKGKAAHWYANDSVTFAPMHYGLIYNWNAAMDLSSDPEDEFATNQYGMNHNSITGWNPIARIYTPHRGICPKGWHIPSVEEWQSLEDTVTGGSGGNGAKLSTGCDWSSENSTTAYSPNNYEIDHNNSGFSILPVGITVLSANPLYFQANYDAGKYAAFTTSTLVNTNEPSYRLLSHSQSSMTNSNGLGNTPAFYMLHSVRCVRDTGNASPTLPADPVSLSVTTDHPVVTLCLTAGDYYNPVYAPVTVTYTASLTGSGDLTGYTYTWSVQPSGFSYTTDGNTCTVTYTTKPAPGHQPHIICHATKGSVTKTGSILQSYQVSNVLPTFLTCVDGLSVMVRNDANHNSESPRPSINWGDGTTETNLSSNLLSGPSHLYAAPGTYNITVANESGCTATKQVTVYSDDEPISPCSGTAHQGGIYEGQGYNGVNDGHEYSNTQGITKVTDYDGNIYPVVQIGELCWMKENLRCTHSPLTGTLILNPQNLSGNASTSSYVSKVAHWYMNDASHADKHYGLLYNWCAAMDLYNGDNELPVANQSGAAWSYSSTAARRGICPRGWHLPTKTEIETLVSSAGSGNNMAGTCEWNYCFSNSSDFTAVPGGEMISSIGFANSGDNSGSTLFGYYWTATEKNSGEAYRLSLTNTSAGENPSVSADAASLGYKNYGYSVRCVRDAE